MKEKKDYAIGVKYKTGDAITNMEGAMHTFLIPIACIHMLGDYKWSNGHNINRFPPGMARKLILSAAVQPDLEFDNVIMKIVALEQYQI